MYIEWILGWVLIVVLYLAFLTPVTALALVVLYGLAWLVCGLVRLISSLIRFVVDTARKIWELVRGTPA